ncbi:hypothetical protein ScPMuIL_008888 [Solemya velum]
MLTSEYAVMNSEYRFRSDEMSEEKDARFIKPSCWKMKTEHHSDYNERSLGFNTVSDVKKRKQQRDQVSHRMIEKRRRDRMNNCLANLSQIIPSCYLKKGQGRIEKTEIIETAMKCIHHLRQLCSDNRFEKTTNTDKGINNNMTCCGEKFYLGFRECQIEVIRYLVEEEGWDDKEHLFRRLIGHLGISSEKFLHTGFLHQMEIANTDPGTTGSVEVAKKTDISLAEDEPIVSTTCSNQRPSTSNQRGPDEKGSMGPDCIQAFSNEMPFLGMNQDRYIESSPVAMDCEGTSVSSGDSGVGPIYKFKQGITKRFSQQKMVSNRNHSLSSNDSYQDDSDQNNLFGKSFAKDSIPEDNNKNNRQKTDLKMVLLSRNHSVNSMLPAFVLHPSGKYYVPVKILTSNIDDLIPYHPSSSSETYHPVNIPVSFDRPGVWIQNGESKSDSENEDSGYSTESRDQSN